MKKLLLIISMLVILCSCSTTGSDQLSTSTSAKSPSITKTSQSDQGNIETDQVNESSDGVQKPEDPCPGIVKSLDLPLNILMKANNHSEILKYDAVTQDTAILIDTEDPESYPYLSPDGYWLYWVDFPLLFEEQGKYSSASGAKKLVILNLPTGNKFSISLPDEWLTALPQGWTSDGNIKLMTNIQQAEDSNQTITQDYAIFAPETGKIIRTISRKFGSQDMYYSLHLHDGFAQYRPEYNEILFTGLEPYTVYFENSFGTVIWKSQVYENIFHTQSENIWSPDGKKAIFFSSTIVNHGEMIDITGNIFLPHALALREVSIPSLSVGDRTTLAFWFWSPLSDYVNVSFLNKSVYIGEVPGSIINSDGNVTVGYDYLIDIENNLVKPICVQNSYFYSGEFTDSAQNLFLFTVVSDNGQASIWLLDSNKWEMMNILSYQLKEEYIQAIGVIGR